MNLFRNKLKNVECSSCDGVHLKWERSLSTRLFHSTIILMIPISTNLSSHETCVNCCVLLKSLFRYSGANKCTLKYLGKTSLFLLIGLTLLGAVQFLPTCFSRSSHSPTFNSSEESLTNFQLKLKTFLPTFLLSTRLYSHIRWHKIIIQQNAALVFKLVHGKFRLAALVNPMSNLCSTSIKIFNSVQKRSSN